MPPSTVPREDRDDPSQAALESARVRFKQFFTELGERFVEREDAIRQIALGLLGKEHVLLTGPPGTAKSALARTVLGNVVDRSSGRPSLFAKQFTESTVQTDLIGPLDFKTLMESGRSEHFTDEGMLGAVHAFLDEVLDGRDMLLRATLNVLQERELKQGTKTTSGAIECAVMTTNRYLSEVLEQSRDTLLAFVDRIAFVSFVPKSFTDPEHLVLVLTGQLGPRNRVPMPSLTIQDVDLLQELVGFVRFPEAVSRELVALLDRLEKEMAVAMRADPRFVPTRYLSTRTAVRTARLLRAIVVFDWIMNDVTRPLSVRASDFSWLRLTLLLGGPALEQLPALLQREPDSRERRQLSIYRTERQIFERVLAGVAHDAIPEEAEGFALPTLGELRAQSLEEQIETCEKLLRHAEQGGRAAVVARQRLHSLTELLSQRVLSHALQAGIVDAESDAAVSNLERIAKLLEAGPPEASELVSLLRTRALELLETRADVALTTREAVIRAARSGKFDLEDSLKHTREQIRDIEDRMRLRDALIRGGAGPRADSAERWARVVDRLLDEVVQLWELGFDAHLARAVARSSQRPLEALLEGIQLPLSQMNACGRWFVPLGKAATSVASRVVGTKLMPFIEDALNREGYQTREAVADAIEGLLQELDEADAHWAVSSTALIEWAARALIDVEGPPRKAKRKLSYEGYRDFRKRQPSSALCHALVEVCTHIALASPELRSNQAPSLALVRDQLAVLPKELLARIAEADERRINTALGFFEAWWKELSDRSKTAEEQLGALLDSRLYDLLERESALVRFTLEAELLGELIPQAAETSAALRRRLRDFSQGVQSHLHGVMHARSLAER